MKLSSKLFNKSKQNSEVFLKELMYQQEVNMSRSKKLLETAKKACTFSKFTIFMLIFVMVCLVFTGKIYLDMMVMVLNNLEAIKEFLFRR